MQWANYAHPEAQVEAKRPFQYSGISENVFPFALITSRMGIYCKNI